MYLPYYVQFLYFYTNNLLFYFLITISDLIFIRGVKNRSSQDFDLRLYNV